jgi:hypothetical protein
LYFTSTADFSSYLADQLQLWHVLINNSLSTFRLLRPIPNTDLLSLLAERMFFGNRKTGLSEHVIFASSTLGEEGFGNNLKLRKSGLSRALSNTKKKSFKFSRDPFGFP